MAPHPLYELSRDRLKLLAEYADQSIRAWSAGCDFLVEQVENCITPRELKFSAGDLRQAGRQFEEAMTHLRPAFRIDVSIYWHICGASFLPCDPDIERRIQQLIEGIKPKNPQQKNDAAIWRKETLRPMRKRHGRILLQLEHWRDAIANRISEMSPKVRCDNHDRDQWIYEACLAGKAYASIVLELKKHCAANDSWNPLHSVQAIRQAANRHAKRNQLQPPPNRHNR